MGLEDTVVRTVRTLLSMMSRRGYTLFFRPGDEAGMRCPHDDERVYSLVDSADASHNNILWVARCTARGTCEWIVVMLVPRADFKINVQFLRALPANVQAALDTIVPREEDIAPIASRVIIVTGQPMTPVATKEPCDVAIENFLLDELRYDLTRQRLHRPYTLLVGAEKEAALAKAGGPKRTIKQQELPQLPVTDVAARWYGLRIGDVVRLPQVFGMVEEHEMFRQVVANKQQDVKKGYKATPSSVIVR